MIGAFELERHHPARHLFRLGAVRHLFRQTPDMAVQNLRVARIVGECRFITDRLHRAVARDAAGVLAPCQMPQPVPHAAKARDEIGLFPPQEIGKAADAGLLQCSLGGGTDAPDHAHGFVAQKVRRFPRADDREPMRLVEVRGDLGQKLVVAQPDGAGQPQFGFHPPHQPRQHHRRGLAVQPRGAGHVEKGFVQRQRLDGRGHLFHHGADRTGGFDIDLHPRLDDHRFGAELERLKHRHGRAHAANARDIASGRHDPAPSPADDDGFAREFGIVAFFDRSIEGVAIHMGDGEVKEFRVGQHARAAAARTAPRRRDFRQTIATEGSHGYTGRAGFGRRF